MTDRTLNLLAVGDLIPGPDADIAFSLTESVLKQGDLVVGQLEVPHTEVEPENVALGAIPIASGNSISSLRSLVSAGFDVLTFAGNHLMDAGPAGIEETIAWLKQQGIGVLGAGMNINEARRSLIVEREGTRFGFLDYNCVGPKEAWAGPNKPGCAYVDIITHYEPIYGTPGGPPSIYTWAQTNSLREMVKDIENLRPMCDILVVSLHKGLGHTPAKLADYELQVSHAAIDAGADLILSHHAHILKGIEIYKGKTIFHGLCNFVTYVPSLAPGFSDDPDSWARKRIEIFGFEPDPEYPTYPFHPEAKYTIIAKCAIEGKSIVRTSFIPCIINKQGHPEIVSREGRGPEVFAYMEKITRRANLNANFAWTGDEVAVNS